MCLYHCHLAKKHTLDDLVGKEFIEWILDNIGLLEAHDNWVWGMRQLGMTLNTTQPQRLGKDAIQGSRHRM